MKFARVLLLEEKKRERENNKSFAHWFTFKSISICLRMDMESWVDYQSTEKKNRERRRWSKVKRVHVASIKIRTIKQVEEKRVGEFGWLLAATIALKPVKSTKHLVCFTLQFHWIKLFFFFHFISFYLSALFYILKISLLLC